MPIPRPIALTSGEPAGIGPDLCVQLAQLSSHSLNGMVVLADSDVLQQRADMLGLPLTLLPYQDDEEPICGEGILTILEHPVTSKVKPGKLDKANGHDVIAMIDTAIHGCMDGRFKAMVTGPVQKSLINEAGINFTGHTEYLALKSRTGQVVMMLATEGLRVALVTTHMPLSQVPASITPDLLTRVIEVLNKGLKEYFALSRPRILVCGLNPHAGEGGHLGREEIDIIKPVITRLQAEGINLTGPLPADTLFTPEILDRADAVLAMYHDQGLPVIKHMGFGKASNITLGLPFIRTSVDHGTALKLAGTGQADHGSMLAAIHMAQDMAAARTPS